MNELVLIGNMNKWESCSGFMRLKGWSFATESNEIHGALMYVILQLLQQMSYLRGQFLTQHQVQQQLVISTLTRPLTYPIHLFFAPPSYCMLSFLHVYYTSCRLLMRKREESPRDSRLLKFMTGSNGWITPFSLYSSSRYNNCRTYDDSACHHIKPSDDRFVQLWWVVLLIH
jgi:hypothetical protein